MTLDNMVNAHSGKAVQECDQDFHPGEPGFSQANPMRLKYLRKPGAKKCLLAIFSLILSLQLSAQIPRCGV
ncbi:MAG: hypothetical protein IPI66_11100 [Chitinophagaceae bacterium]|nr:hypothetical protein [Chitinophagaceae bacterium]